MNGIDEFTFPGILFGFALWLGVLWLVRTPLRRRQPMDIGVRSAFIVTFIGLLAALSVSNLSLRIAGVGDLTNIAIFMTRAIVIVGAVYAYVAIFLAWRRGRVGGPL